MEKTWVFKNKTTGATAEFTVQKTSELKQKPVGDEVEENDVRFLFENLLTVKGLIMPASAGVDLLLRGETDCTVQTIQGESFDVRIQEKTCAN